MKNEDELKKKEKEKVAQEYLFTALLTLGFNLRILQQFFNHVYTTFRDQRKTLFDSIEGGYRRRSIYDDYAEVKINPVAEIGDYYIVRTADLLRTPTATKRATSADRDCALTKTALFEVFIHRIFWDDSWANYREVIRAFDPAFINLKKNKEARTIIRMASVQVLLCGGQMEEKHVTEFRNEQVPYWRNALETLRVELHLSGKNTYNDEIQQVDSFLKILETSN